MEKGLEVDAQGITIGFRYNFMWNEPDREIMVEGPVMDIMREGQDDFALVRYNPDKAYLKVRLAGVRILGPIPVRDPYRFMPDGITAGSDGIWESA